MRFSSEYAMTNITNMTTNGFFWPLGFIHNSDTESIHGWNFKNSIDEYVLETKTENCFMTDIQNYKAILQKQ